MRRTDVTVLAALLALASAGAHADGWPDVPMPDGAQGEWVARDMVNNGLPMRASRYQVPMTPAQLVEYLRRAWNGMVVVDEIGEQTIVGHAQDDHYVTVDIRREGTGSVAQVGIVRMSAQRPSTAPGKDFPRPSGSRVVNDIEYIDEPGRTLSVEAPLSPYQSDTYYRQRLPGDGWKLDVAGSRPCVAMSVQCSSSYSRGKETMVLTFTRMAEGTSIVANQTRR